MFLNLDTVDILDDVILCHRELYCVLWDVWQNLWSLSTRRQQLFPPSVVTIKSVCRHCYMFAGDEGQNTPVNHYFVQKMKNPLKFDFVQVHQTYFF